MKIQGNQPKLTGQEKAGQGDKIRDEGARVKSNQAQSQRKLSTDLPNLTVGKMRERIQNEPDVNLDRVKALKAKIKDGSYKIDSTKLAGNLLKESALEDI